MKIVVAPDSFKGSLSARRVATLASEELAARIPDATISEIPLADGGEGSLEAIIAALGGSIETADVASPDGRLISAKLGVLGATVGRKAVLEAAQSSGITRQIGLHPMDSNTFGFGQLIMHALDQGLRDFVLCLGGTATTDGGCAMASVLGVKFLDSTGKTFVPTGATLPKIAHIDASGIDERVRQSTFTVLYDVENPLYGPNGAAFVYAPQKGADTQQVSILDDGLRHLAEVVLRDLGVDHAHNPGAGAGGGLGFGCAALLNAHLTRGIDAILNLYDFEHHVADTDIIITGEGKLDDQSFSGKVLSGILHRAGDIPVISICGTCACEDDQLRERNLTVFELSEGVTPEESLLDPERYLRRAVSRAMDTLPEAAVRDHGPLD